METFDITVVTPVYNAEMLLARCIESVLNQKTKYSIEFILVDDGSQDNSVEIIHRYQQGYHNIILHQQQNSGPAVARNKGIELARGEYCAYLDADDYWESTFVEKTLDFLKMHDECVAVTVGQKHCVYGRSEIVKPDFLEEKSNIPLAQQAQVLYDFFTTWSKYNHVCTGSVTLKTKIVLQMGGQRKDMRICEDTEFWLLMATYGKIGFIPEILFTSDGGAIVAQQGWKKYMKRFQNIPSFDVWFIRLKERMTKEQIATVSRNLNGVVCGISRAKISGGDFCGAYANLKNYIGQDEKPLMLKVAASGKLPFYCFAFTYRLYQYLKINKGVILKKYIYNESSINIALFRKV